VLGRGYLVDLGNSREKYVGLGTLEKAASVFTEPAFMASFK